jgi:opacity protein-like surface antigen
MITNLRNSFNFAKIILASTFLFLTLSSISKAENRFFYQLGAGYVEGNSHSNFTRSPFSNPPFAGNIQGYRVDFGLGLSSEINKIKVDYILSYAPDAFGNQVDTKNSCPNPDYECRVNIKDSLNLGAKFYLPSNASKITPTIYFGVSNADIQLKTFYRRAGANFAMMSHQRNWGATAGLGLNYDLNNDTAISLDYSWTAYEKNEEEVDSSPSFAKSRVEINSLSLKLKKYF